MSFVLSLQELWRRRVFVIPGLILAFALATIAVFQVGSGFKSRERTTWVAGTQALVDAEQSAIGDLHQGLDPLIPRATIYANMMTGQALLNVIGQTANIPPSEISVKGPVDTNGQRTVHGASSTAPNAPEYTLQLDTDVTQPIIAISAEAPSRQASTALANGAATGLRTYVTQLEDSQRVPPQYRVNIRQVGEATANEVSSGIPPILFLPIFLLVATVWCLIVLTVTRFAVAWRLAPPQGDRNAHELARSALSEEASDSGQVGQEPDPRDPEPAPAGLGTATHEEDGKPRSVAVRFARSEPVRARSAGKADAG